MEVIIGICFRFFSYILEFIGYYQVVKIERNFMWLEVSMFFIEVIINFFLILCIVGSQINEYFEQEIGRYFVFCFSLIFYDLFGQTQLFFGFWVFDLIAFVLSESCCVFSINIYFGFRSMFFWFRVIDQFGNKGGVVDCLFVFFLRFLC